jgi:hypothetical protein
MNMKRWTRWCVVAVALLAATVFVYAGCLRIFAGFTLQRIASPDGAVIAEVNTSGAAGATDTTYTGVMLRSRLNPFREYVFGGLDYGVHITAGWTGSRNLLITCEDCTRLSGGNIKLDHWRDVAIRYEIR